jgi:uncharacterized OB-fold protein
MGISKIVMALDDKPMWASIEAHRLELQKCTQCGEFRYPPAPVCPHDLNDQVVWTAVSGKGTIISWVIFHRQYFEDHVPPYNSTAVRLDEGPIIVTQLQGEEPEGSWIGERVELTYGEHAGRTQHFARWLKPEAA